MAGEIREVLVLEDRFSSGLSRYADLVNRASASTEELNRSIEDVERTSRLLNTTYNTQTAQIRRNTMEIRQQTAELQRQSAQLHLEEQQARAAQRAQNAHDQSIRRVTSAIKGFAGAYMGIQGAKALVGLSDTMSQIDARMNQINQSFGTNLDLQEMVFQAAQDSRGSYTDMADMVGKLGTLAGDAFQSPEELVAFSEQFQKHLALSGAGVQQAQAATLQLTQALSSGTLRGDELNSILENNSSFANTLANSLGMDVGAMRELAAAGGLTTDVIKNGILSAAKETNVAFEEMPYTWGQVFTTFQNIVIQALGPVLDIIKSVAQFTAEHIESLMPVFYSLAAGLGAAAIAYGVYTAATKLAKLASDGFFKTLLTNPFTRIAVVVGTLVGLFLSWADSVGGVQVAFAIMKDKVLTIVEDIYLKLVEWYAKVQTGFSDFKTYILVKAEDLVNGLIDMLNGLIEWANKTFNWSINTIDRVSFGAEAEMENKALHSEMDAYVQEAQARVAENRAARAAEIEEAKAAAAEKAANDGTEVYSPDLTAAAVNTGNTAKGIEDLNKAVNLADEDIKSLVDIATRKYINNVNLTTQAPVIQVTGQNTGSTAEDRRRLADTLRDIILEQSAAGSASVVAPV